MHQGDHDDLDGLGSTEQAFGSVDGDNIGPDARDQPSSRSIDMIAVLSWMGLFSAMGLCTRSFTACFLFLISHSAFGLFMTVDVAMVMPDFKLVSRG